MIFFLPSIVAAAPAAPAAVAPALVWPFRRRRRPAHPKPTYYYFDDRNGAYFKTPFKL